MDLEVAVRHEIWEDDFGRFGLEAEELQPKVLQELEHGKNM